MYKRTAAMFFVLCTVSLFVIGGCPDMMSSGTTSRSSDEYSVPEGLGAAGDTQLQFADLPVPQNFELIRERSFSKEDQNSRMAYLFYQGRGSIEEVINFYKESMPLNRWSFESKSGLADRVTLKYNKEGEICTVTIGMEAKRKTSVFIQVYKDYGAKEGAGK